MQNAKFLSVCISTMFATDLKILFNIVFLPSSGKSIVEIFAILLKFFRMVGIEAKTQRGSSGLAKSEILVKRFFS